LKVRENPSFSHALRAALSLPVLAAVLAWLCQWFFRFPQGSLGVSVTAAVFVFAPFAEIIPAPIAITKLVRHSSLRSPANIAFTALGVALLSLGALFLFALFSR
jgi:hypothetical protein